MDVRIIVETTTETGEKRKQQIIRFNLPGQCHGDLGLKLEHSKTLLAQLQKSIVQHQIEEISDASRNCPCCGRVMPIHDYRTRVLDTLFGRFPLRVPPRKCVCRRGKGGSLSQVFRDRVTPELKLLQAELGARHSFREEARILEIFLPCARQHNTTVRNRLGKVAKAIAEETPPICESQKSHPLTVSSTALMFGAGRNTRNVISMLWWAKLKPATCAAALAFHHKLQGRRYPSLGEI